MSLTNDARFWMNKREELSKSELGVIDSAFDAIYEHCGMADIKAATDDRAAELEASLIKFIIVSR